MCAYHTVCIYAITICDAPVPVPGGSVSDGSRVQSFSLPVCVRLFHFRVSLSLL